MKRVLVTGGSGFLGWNLCELASARYEVFSTCYSHPVSVHGARILKVDLRNYREIRELFLEVQPEGVIHTAAISKPDFCEINPEDTYRINVEASAVIAELCSDRGIPLVFTSTDLVFDGLNPPYSEDDPVSPINKYGEQKVLAEMELQRRCSRTVVCRLPLMFGHAPPSSESFLQPLLAGIREGREIRLFNDQYRTPVSARTAAFGLLIALERGNGIIHLGGNERISRYEFGRRLAQILGKDNARLTPCSMRDFPTIAARAPDASLRNDKAKSLGFNPPPLDLELRHLCNAL